MTRRPVNNDLKPRSLAAPRRRAASLLALWTAFCVTALNSRGARAETGSECAPTAPAACSTPRACYEQGLELREANRHREAAAAFEAGLELLASELVNQQRRLHDEICEALFEQAVVDHAMCSVDLAIGACTRASSPRLPTLHHWRGAVTSLERFESTWAVVRQGLDLARGEAP